MNPRSRWVLRAGSAASIASFFLPCLEMSNSLSATVRYSPFLFCWSPPVSEESGALFAFDAAGYLAPLLVGTLLLADTCFPERPRRGLHWLLVIVSVAWAFGLATEGSLLHTIGDPAGLRIPRALALALFVGPVTIGAGVASQILRGAPPATTGLVVRGALGMLMLLCGLYRQSGWGCSGGWGRVLSFLLPLAGLLVLASGALDLFGRPSESEAPGASPGRA